MRPIRAATLLLLVALAPSKVTAAGVNLRWTRCHGDGGEMNRVFACDRNTGSNVLVGSFVLESGLSGVNSTEFTVDLTVAAANLPAWWQFKNVGTCRMTSLSFNVAANPNDVVCQDWTAGMATGGIGAYTVGLLGPSTARIRGALAVPASAFVDLLPNTEYFSFNLTINNTKTTGFGACQGCAIPACLALTSMTHYYAGGTSTWVLTTPAYGTDSHYVGWQGGSGVVPFANGACAGFDSAGFAIQTSVVGRGVVERSRTKDKYPPGSPVTLTAVPLVGDRFVSWSGDTATTEPILNVTVWDHPLSYLATFERDPAYAADVTAVLDAPDDQGSQVEVQWDRSPLDNGSPLLCCYEVEQRPSGTSDPWTAIGQVPVSGVLGYSLVVSTPADSTASDPALFDFRVLTKIADQSTAWVSDVVQGYSVDNLAPPAPDYVSGSMASGLATMFWPAVNVADLDHYVVYRSTDGTPPTDTEHRIGTSTVTGYNDAPGFLAYYVVTAVDVHGNEGAARAFVPANNVGLNDRPPPSSLTLGQPTPSPMARSMSLALGLPRASNVAVEVVDPQGRLLRRLDEGALPAGWHTIRWDARDARGVVVPAGIYFLRVKTEAGLQLRRVALLP